MILVGLVVLEERTDSAVKASASPVRAFPSRRLFEDKVATDSIDRAEGAKGCQRPDGANEEPTPGETKRRRGGDPPRPADSSAHRKQETPGAHGRNVSPGQSAYRPPGSPWSRRIDDASAPILALRE